MDFFSHAPDNQHVDVVHLITKKTKKGGQVLRTYEDVLLSRDHFFIWESLLIRNIPFP